MREEDKREEREGKAGQQKAIRLFCRPPTQMELKQAQQHSIRRKEHHDE